MSEFGEHTKEPPQAAGRFQWWRPLIGRNPKATFIRSLVLVLVCFVVFRFVALPVRVRGVSMEPTYRNGKVNLINRLAYLGSEPRRGDVVGVTFTGESIQLLKRIIALPGETFAMRRGVTMIDGQALDEPYTVVNESWTTRTERTLGPFEYVVIGDNRSMVMRLHTWGVVDRSRIVGKAVF